MYSNTPTLSRRPRRWAGAILAAAMALAPLAASAKSAPAAPEAGKSEYLALKPSFVANYGGPGPIHFLKADIALRLGKDDKAALQVDRHMPYIRHVLVMLLSAQTDETMSTMEGKEKLRLDALAAIQKLLKEEEGKPLVDDLLFTNFVVQR